MGYDFAMKYFYGSGTRTMDIYMPDNNFIRGLRIGIPNYKDIQQRDIIEISHLCEL